MSQQDLQGWGRYPVIPADVVSTENLESASVGAMLSRGLGRAYGDAALPTPGGRVMKTPLADRFLSFDRDTGILRAEAGLSLYRLIRTMLPQGYFTPVTPGTQYVTLGGMVASDVHGKNHHTCGTFGSALRALKIRTGAGEIVEASPESHSDLFWATIGGMGLTGHILEVEVQLEKVPSPYIYEETERFDSLAEIYQALGEASHDWPMTVCWVDTSARGAKLGRGILIKARWAEAHEAPAQRIQWRNAPSVPDIFPSWVMNRVTVKWMNTLYFWLHGAEKRIHYASPERCFYQLDLLRHWNRGYGKRGFTQYQCVMPRSAEVYEEFLRMFQKLGGCSFVTVFKDCGPEGNGLLSFPTEGTSLAIDIPITSGTERLIHELNAFVLDKGGRIYLTKDAFSNQEEIRQMYPRLDQFLEVRDRYDPEGNIKSALGVRVMGR